MQRRIGATLEKRFPDGVEIASRFMRARDYLGKHLDGLLAPEPRARARQALTKRPLSLFVLVMRASRKQADGSAVPLAEWIYDTTAGYFEPALFACLCADKTAHKLLGVPELVDPFR